MKTLGVLLFGLGLVMSVAAQEKETRNVSNSKYRVASKGTPYLSGNRVNGEQPEPFKDFVLFWVEAKVPNNYEGDYLDLLKPDAQGRIPINGRVTIKCDSCSRGRENYFFKTAALIEEEGRPVRLVFTTRSRNGVEYSFEGTYLDHPELAATGNYTHLRGTLTRIKDGQKVAEATLDFSPFTADRVSVTR
jgi:hypothetical protein